VSDNPIEARFNRVLEVWRLSFNISGFKPRISDEVESWRGELIGF